MRRKPNSEKLQINYFPNNYMLINLHIEKYIKPFLYEQSTSTDIIYGPSISRDEKDQYFSLEDVKKLIDLKYIPNCNCIINISCKLYSIKHNFFYLLTRYNFSPIQRYTRVVLNTFFFTYKILLRYD